MPTFPTVRTVEVILSALISGFEPGERVHENDILGALYGLQCDGRYSAEVLDCLDVLVARRELRRECSPEGGLHYWRDGDV